MASKSRSGRHDDVRPSVRLAVERAVRRQVIVLVIVVCIGLSSGPLLWMILSIWRVLFVLAAMLRRERHGLADHFEVGCNRARRVDRDKPVVLRLRQLRRAGDVQVRGVEDVQKVYARDRTGVRRDRQPGQEGVVTLRHCGACVERRGVPVVAVVHVRQRVTELGGGATRAGVNKTEQLGLDGQRRSRCSRGPTCGP